jgi:ABC-type uncharacterized transport system permease subunit
MTKFLFAIPSLIFYLLAAGCQLGRFFSLTNYNKSMLLGCAWFAILLHSIMLYLLIDGSAMGQNLSLLNILSQIAWLTALFTTFSLYFFPLDNLALVIYPSNALSILLVLLFPVQRIVHTADNPAQLLHISLFLLALSWFFIATLQALIVLFQHYYLKKPHHLFLLESLPPLDQMERLLFQMLLWGFFFLSFMMLTSLISFDDYLKQHLEHIALACFAWVIYFILLIGRYKLGWRGIQSVMFTLAGFLVLLLCYLMIQQSLI